MQKFNPDGIFFLLISVLFFSGCNGGGSSINNGLKVYAGGYFESKADSETVTKEISCYWIDGVKQDLNSIHKSRVTSIFVYGGKVYTGGYFQNAKENDTDPEKPEVPCYWENVNQIDLLDNNSLSARVNSIFIYQGTVYTGGFNGTIPCYWQSKQQKDLTGITCTSIFISKGDVYAGGYFNNGTYNTPCYWKNNDRIVLVGGNHDESVNSIFVYQDTVYTGGSYWDGGKNVACYWIGNNPTPQIINSSSKSEVKSIFVYNGTVYAGGYYNNGTNDVPCYWDNSGIKVLGSENGCVNSIIVFNGTVYAGGYYHDGTKDIPCYWVNTEKHNLDPGKDNPDEGITIKNARVNSIYVKAYNSFAQ